MRIANRISFWVMTVGWFSLFLAMGAGAPLICLGACAAMAGVGLLWTVATMEQEN
jgi:hypothetical protein